jgi:phage tail sheath gpL-like
MPVDATAVARVTGIKTQYKDMRQGSALNLPQHIAVFAPGSDSVVYSSEKFVVTGGSAEVGRRLGWGSLADLIVDELLPLSGDGVGTVRVTVFPLQPGYEGVAATGAITPTGSQTESKRYRVRVAGRLSSAFVINPDDSIASICTKIANAINGTLRMPVVATAGPTSVALQVKWSGESGNDVLVELLGELSGVTFGITQPSGGLINPDVTEALEQIGSQWVTMGINGLNIEDTDALDAYQEFGGTPGTETTPGSGRWDPLVQKPLVVFTGNTKANVAAATTETSARRGDAVNVQMPAPGSPNLPAVVAARAVARIARLANNIPAHDYGSQLLDRIIPGTDAEQWDYAQRDFAVKSGSSTVEKGDDDVLRISDVVTCYRPEGEEPPPYRHVVDIVKLQNILFNIALEFKRPEWDGAPLVGDDEPVTEPTAKKPKNAKSRASQIIENLANAAILTNREQAKANTQAWIGGPKRLNLRIPVQLSGNVNQKAITLEWGFDFGSAPAA